MYDESLIIFTYCEVAADCIHVFVKDCFVKITCILMNLSECSRPIGCRSRDFGSIHVPYHLIKVELRKIDRPSVSFLL